jgi:hypothetical protein
MCTIIANQPIYKALIDKAASYPADQPYKAKAYLKGALAVAAYNKSIYDDYHNKTFFTSGIEGVPKNGSVEWFIYMMIADTPRGLPPVAILYTALAAVRDNAMNATRKSAPAANSN